MKTDTSILKKGVKTGKCQIISHLRPVFRLLEVPVCLQKIHSLQSEWCPYIEIP